MIYTVYCICIYSHICMQHAQVHAYTGARIVHACAHARMRAHGHAHIHAHANIHVHKYTYTYTDTHTHINITYAYTNARLLGCLLTFSFLLTRFLLACLLAGLLACLLACLLAFLPIYLLSKTRMCICTHVATYIHTYYRYVLYICARTRR